MADHAAAGWKQRPRLDDETLLVRIRAGDQAAFDALYDRYFPRIYRFVEKRMGIPADVDETVQEVFFNVFQSLDSYRGEAPLAAWIFGLTRRTIASRYKKKRHATVPLEDEDPERPSTGNATQAVSPEPSPLESYEVRERIQRLEDRASTQLTREQRHLFELHHLENWSIAEIAAFLHKTEDSVKSNLYRTRKLLLSA